MTLYQIVDETNFNVNAFQQREMALCHLDVVKELSPEHQYHIHVGNVKKDHRFDESAVNLIVNFG